MKRHFAVAMLANSLLLTLAAFVVHVAVLVGYTSADVPPTPLVQALSLAGLVSFGGVVMMACLKRNDNYDEQWPPLLAPTPGRHRAGRWGAGVPLACAIAWFAATVWVSETMAERQALRDYAANATSTALLLTVAAYVAVVLAIGFKGLFPRWQRNRITVFTLIGYLASRFSARSRTQWRRNRRKTNRRRALIHADRMARRPEWPR